MIDRNTFFEIALGSMPDGVAIFDSEGLVVFWNAAAEAITDYSATDVQTSVLPTGLKQLLHEETHPSDSGPNEIASSSRGTQVHIRHKLGHEFSVMIRTMELRESGGEVIGKTVLFHPAERLDALPHGEAGEDQLVASSQEEFEARLYVEYEEFERGGQPLGILWLIVDQAHDLRKTHGVAAYHAMLEKVQHALASGLHPGEELARWGEEEFLILAHQRTSEKLAAHARTLAGLARTADFRWWGDRVSLTVSIGAAQARGRRPLHELLERAKKAMEDSMREGGNRVTCTLRDDNNDPFSGEELICTPS